ncbi:hypothetical protein PRIPAC_90506 [Pristionchus pacificus]|uniref:Uncharacterized protein n=1 Tax=Pristionchus pacificus TaxID=54126 RepID=A0A2A6B8N4_PRIPA|nr:hypothetical protein PRIPAC_90506 [Pristionchus pacificus]|eukprot:PDM62239.1 hypothetical protein PRIPAC_51681 [Pristionchus pacificus]
MSSPQPLLSQSSSADFWQKSHHNSHSSSSFRNAPPSHGEKAATNGELADAYWSPSSNPFYGGGGGGKGNGGGPPLPAASSPSMKQRFPLQLPPQQANSSQNLPRARLREERYVAPPPTANGTASNGNSIGYKLANQRIGAPPMMMNVNEQRSPYTNGHAQQHQLQQRHLQQMQQQPGVWTVEAERLAREARRQQPVMQQTKVLQMQQPPPPAAIVKYGDKSGGGGSPPRGTNGRKPQRWGRIMQTLCCCIALNRENGEKLPPINASPTISDKPKIQKPTSNGTVAPSASPITQITQKGEGKTGLNGATAYQQAEITLSPGSYKKRFRVLMP